MIERIEIEGFIVFEKAGVDLGPGLTVLSGETGAGKSLLVKALTLALGARASSDVVRTGSEAARVRARLRLDGTVAEAAREALVAEDDPGEYVLLERTVRADGRSRLTRNRKATNLADVRDAAQHIVDIAAQHEYTRLMEPAYQRELLDRHGGLLQARGAFAECFSRATGLARRLSAGDAERARVQARVEEVREDLDRIAEVGYDPDADADLESRIDALSRAETIRELCERAVDTLYEGDDSVQDTTGHLQRECDALGEICPPLAEAAERLGESTAALEEAVRCFREAETSLDISSGEADRLVERSEEIRRLARRLGCQPAELPEVEARLRAEEEELAGWSEDTGKIRKDLDGALAEAAKAGLALRKARLKAAEALAVRVNDELADLDMPDAGFDIALAPLWADGDEPEEMLATASAQGLEDVVYRLSANPGEPPAALSETASGGEMSRAMLAIKAALAEVHCPPVLVFDEIDAGVGGRLGDTMARKLAALARTRQVLVVTHTPQIAARADTHLRVAKHVKGKRTFSTVEPLDATARIDEVAQMIRGKESTDVTRKQAEEMLRAGAGQ